jgi:hypothetical protein
LCRTDFFTDCAISAFLVSQKRFIHLVNIRIRLAIKQRKKNILPGRTFFQRVYFFWSNSCRDSVNFLSSFIKSILLLIRRNSTTPGNVIARQVNREAWKKVKTPGLQKLF